jgi:hypothetical protein
MITYGDWLVLIYILGILVLFCGLAEWIAKLITKKGD